MMRPIYIRLVASARKSAYAIPCPCARSREIVVPPSEPSQGCSMPIRRRSPAVCIALVLLLSCAHGEPFAPADQGLEGPLAPSQPTRLTYSTSPDAAPAWLGDTAIVYSFESAERHGDVCLGVLPADGGTRTLSLCNVDAAAQGAFDFYYQPATQPDGTLGLLLKRAPTVSATGDYGIAISSLGALPAATMLRTLPFVTPDGLIDEVRLLRWLAPGSLIFLGQDYGTFTPCPTCDPVTVPRWKDAFRLSAEAGAMPQIVPGTRFATSVAPGLGTNDLFVTLANDGRVYRQDATTGQVLQVVANLGAAAAARDVDYASGKLAVISDGKVLQLTADDGPAQTADEGGLLSVVDVATGTITPYPVPQLFFRQPRVSPDGRSLVAEGHSFTIVTIPQGFNPPIFDTIVDPAGSIYKLSLQ